VYLQILLQWYNVSNIENLTAWIIAISALLSALLGLILNFKKIMELLNKFFGIFKFKKNKLNFDPIIIKIDESIRLSSIENIDSTRTEISILLKTIKLKVFKEKIEALKKLDFNKISREELTKILKNVLYEYVSESNNLFKKESNNKEEEETAELILNKFSVNENYNIRTAINLIDDTYNDKSNKKNSDVLDGVLLHYKFIINGIIENSKDTFHRINGKLTGLYFKGKKIGPNADRSL